MSDSNYIHSCSCGLKWNVTKHKLTMRDKDREVCTCGEIIVSWNGAVMYNARLIEDKG
ncbi:hypothetical protein [Paenibacillus macquariensis]|uniref:Uncharacterized protein n=1 Tax=Paenibacillus macquariensis TaxID=948756 RepID=A0ABY1K1F2_9BACL|nr:hypothetical protein [Paenibacillus macquariensis]MEC0091783.1 hypothetical protein [Paenibacillus macquariensis]SIR12063.1 hypothetical protein SAMN05421578_107132 [Paenibacillus macquariensis]